MSLVLFSSYSHTWASKKSDFGLQGERTQYTTEFWNSYFST